MSDTHTEASERRIYIISSASIQTVSLASVIQERTGMKCAVQSELRRVASTVAVTTRPTMILVDSLFLDPSSTLQQLEQLPGPLGSHVMVALMNMAKDELIAVRAVTLGVRGLFYANTDLEFLLKGIRSMFDGEIWVPRRVLADAIVSPSSGGKDGRNVAELLTRRERQILALISTGSSNDEIADQLNISTNTVRTHVYNLYRKIDVPNRMQAVLWGAENL
jgi:DNA-binding NarL/FixJ family response regulator